MTAEYVCRVIYDGDGNAIGRAQVAADITDEEMEALSAVLSYVQKVQEERDAADPEAAAERGRRQQAAIARVRARAGLRGAE